MLTKLVDGKRITLTDKEEVEVRAEWIENERLQEIELAKPVPQTIEERLTALEK